MRIQVTVKQAFELLMWQGDLKLSREFSFTHMGICNHKGELMSNSDIVLVEVDREQFESIREQTAYFDTAIEIIEEEEEEEEVKTVLEIVGDFGEDGKIYAKVYYINGKQHIEGTEDINKATEVAKIRKYARDNFVKLHSYKDNKITLQEVEV